MSNSDPSIIALPEPLYCNAITENVVKVGESVIVNLLTGNRIVGYIEDFDLREGVISIRHLTERKSVTLAFNRAKIIYLPKLRTWVPKEFPEGGDIAIPDLEAIKQKFNVLFQDNDTLEGETLGVSHTKFGIFLYPLQEGHQFIYTFIPQQSMVEHTIGPKLGEILVQEKWVESQQVESIIEEQKRDRDKPLGEYLRAKAVVTAQELERALERQKQMPNMRLGEVLVSENLITEQQLQDALSAQKTHRKKQLGRMLVDKGLVTQEQIQQALAKKLGIAYVDLSKFPAEAEVINKVSSEILRQHKVLPLHIFNGKIIVAVENPLDSRPLEAVAFQTGLAVEPVMAQIEQIEAVLETHLARGTATSINMEDIEADVQSMEGGEAEEEDDKAINNASDNIVIKLANMLITESYKQNASDIHIEPRGAAEKTLVRIRKDGSLIAFYEVPSTLRFSLVSRLKIMAGLDISERRKPQDGKINFRRFSNLPIELRLATLPTAGGQEDVVMRILASGKPIPLEKLALTTSNYDRLRELVKRPHGLFCVCGPTGSGKTTTLHSVLAHLNTPERKIWTAEDPVEITQKGLRQVQVNHKIGLSFAAAMRAFLRADPDIIMVGEMRDEETVHMGVEASLTGHLVFSTLHTNSAPESIVRLLDMGMNPFNFADALIGILAQRLGKRFCSKCVERYTAEPEEIDLLLEEYCFELYRAESVENDEMRKLEIREQVRAHWYKTYFDAEGKLTLGHTKGCSQCNNTGYSGRVGIHELLSATPEIKRLIMEHAPVRQLAAQGMRQGMRTLKQDGIEKVLMGITDIHQIRQIAV